MDPKILIEKAGVSDASAGRETMQSITMRHMNPTGTDNILGRGTGITGTNLKSVATLVSGPGVSA